MHAEQIGQVAAQQFCRQGQKSGKGNHWHLIHITFCWQCDHIRTSSVHCKALNAANANNALTTQRAMTIVCTDLQRNETATTTAQQVRYMMPTLLSRLNSLEISQEF